MSLFVFDRLIDASEFCNFKKERESLLRQLNNNQCVKLFAPRNFGKTSLLKNIISTEWQDVNADKRIAIYVEFYSVKSHEDISLKLSIAFNQALSSKKTLGQKLNQIVQNLKFVRPTWKPPTDENSFGEFSLQSNSGAKYIPFEQLFAQIQNLQIAGTFEFLIIFDEFQEIAHIAKAEAQLRECLQKLSPDIPIVICGSKEHLLQKIFHEPKRPFHNWGSTLELKPILTSEYTEYINGKLSLVNLKINEEASALLQQKLNFIPEQINRVCEFAASQFSGKNFREIKPIDIAPLLKKFISDSESVYSRHFAQLSASERAVILAIANAGKIEKTNSKQFLKFIPSLTAASVNRIIIRLLDGSILQRVAIDNKLHIQLEDPLFALYIQESGLLLSLINND